MRSRATLPLLVLALASAWCVALLVLREREFGSAQYPFLVWNLTLAWVPLILSLLFEAACARHRSRLETAAVGGVWLLFLPNAPYVLTDLVHVGTEHRLYDAIAVGSFAVTALALGFASVLIVQGVVTRARGAVAGWTVVAASLFASSVGIYLGRVKRLNSWDAVSQPHRLWALLRARLEDPLGNPHLLLFVAGLGCFLAIAYLGLYALSTLAAHAPDDRR